MLITNMYPPHHEGGYELSCQDVVERFRARGHEVTVLTTSHRREGVGWSARSEGVRRTLDFYWRNHKPWQPGVADVVRLERHVQRELRAALRELEPDVISLWNMGAVPTSVIATLVRTEIPLVYHVCNDWPHLNLAVDAFRQLLVRHPRAGRVAGRLLGIPTALPDLGSSGDFCWVSRSTWESAERNTPWRFPRSVVVHSGISHDDFPIVEPPTEPRPWRGRLLYVGRIEGTKSTATAIDALPLLDGMTLDLVGPADPGYLRHLLRRADRLGVGDRLTVTSVARPELRDRYLSADAVLFTSLNEPFGLVPIEAMACATPVVGARAGGSAEFLVDGENCVAFPPEDAEALAQGVLRLAGDPELRLAVAKGGLLTAAEFTVDRLADRLEAAHVDAVARGARP